MFWLMRGIFSKSEMVPRMCSKSGGAGVWHWTLDQFDQTSPSPQPLWNLEPSETPYQGWELGSFGQYSHSRCWIFSLRSGLPLSVLLAPDYFPICPDPDGKLKSPLTGFLLFISQFLSVEESGFHPPVKFYQFFPLPIIWQAGTFKFPGYMIIFKADRLLNWVWVSSYGN